MQNEANLPPGWALLFLCSLGSAFGAFVLSGIYLDPLTFAVPIGVLLSVGIGVYVVAPKAGQLAYRRIHRAFVDPSPEDQVMLEGLSVNLVANAARIAQDPEGRKLIRPFFEVANDLLDDSIQKSYANIKSQVSRGAGAFAMSEEPEWIQIVQEGAMPAVDGLLDAVGATDSLKQKVHNKIYLEMLKSGRGGNGGSHQPGNRSPQGGGW